MNNFFIKNLFLIYIFLLIKKINNKFINNFIKKFKLILNKVFKNYYYFF